MKFTQFGKQSSGAKVSYLMKQKIKLFQKMANNEINNE